MPFYRNFTYWIDKRRWKYAFLQASLDLSLSATFIRRTALSSIY